MIKKSIRIEELIPQKDGRFTIVFQEKDGRLVSKPNCAFCIHGEAKLFDEEFFTIHFENVVEYDDIDIVRNQYLK